LRSTFLIHNRTAWRTYRLQAALGAHHGAQFLTIERLAARLAGGFLQPIDPESLKSAVRDALAAPLGELDAIKSLPGFQRAAAATLTKAWSAGLDLNEEKSKANSPAAQVRLDALAAIEREVLARLPPNQLRPRDLVALAFKHIRRARMLFGPVEVRGRTEMAPVWRPLLAEVAKVTKVVWIAEARHVPDWLSSLGITAQTRPPDRPTVGAVSCASPRHEVLEALRWARRHLSVGTNPQDIAIAAASPEAWDDHMLALAGAANLPIHFVHGRAALTTPEGQLTAAVAEVLLRGFSQSRLTRLVSLLRSQNPRFSTLSAAWWRDLPEGAPLLDPERWMRAIAALTPDKFSDRVDYRGVLSEIVNTLAKGLAAAAEIGELLFPPRALAVWRQALAEGPAAALDVTLGGLRVDDGVEPEGAMLWAPASAIAAVPRPLTWLVGLTSRSWPRRAGEDPLLPNHVVPAERLDPLPVHQADWRDFETIKHMTGQELVCSRARRDSEGRINGVSPLYPRDTGEEYLAQSREPEHAANSTDRLFARPLEFATLPSAKAASSAWIDWHKEILTAHDGLVRANHPLLLQALQRRQSASSLVKLLRDPLGYLWTYGFSWSEPEETDEPLTFDPLAFGTLLHEILEEAVTQLEEDSQGGFALASPVEIQLAVEAASDRVAIRWDETLPVPPLLIWRRKRAEAVELAVVALSRREDALPNQRTWAEVPFGGGRRVEELGDKVRASLPWDPLTPVVIPGANMSISGLIDRLDLAGDGSIARVTDYKSGNVRGKPSQLKGGAELQRCLYAYAVNALIPARPQVDAQLLYPRREGLALSLEQPSAILDRLTGYLAAASVSFAAGQALSGPAAEETYYDLAFALPGGATETYLDGKRPLVASVLAAIAPIWDEP
jgi:hypothetical protein